MTEPSDRPEPTLDELACNCSPDHLVEWLRFLAKDRNSQAVTPNDLTRQPHRLTWNQACSTLEQLEHRGDLERLYGPTLAWRLAPPIAKPGRGYSLPLSPKEHAALLWLLDRHLADWQTSDPAVEAKTSTLRRIRARLKRPA